MTSTTTNVYFDRCLVFSSSFSHRLFFCQLEVALVKRHISSVEHTIAAFLHQLVASMSFVVPEKSHLLRTVVKLLPLGRRDQGVGNTAKHSQVAEIRLLPRETSANQHGHTCIWLSQEWSGSSSQQSHSSLAKQVR